MTDSFPKLSLVIGGARSGKSRAAEGLVRSSGLPKTYIATAEAWDDEMRSRIAAHRHDRGGDWHSIEAPRDLPAALALATQSTLKGAILIDCATLWLTNVILAEGNVAEETAALLAALMTSPYPVVVVTNEVGWSIVPENALARRFRDDQGRVNQALAAQADLVLAVVAGLPLVLKGQLPKATS